MTKTAELYGRAAAVPADWPTVVAEQTCPYLGRQCVTKRKGDQAVTLGTCTLNHGKRALPVVICPFRLPERQQVFHDCVHLLALHEPGNELRLIAEVAVPGGKVDYCLVSVRGGRVRDFVGVELQSVDTTGTAWPARQQFVRSHGVAATPADAASARSFGMNWKMSAKTALGQLHHKVMTFGHVGKRLVMVVQDHLLDYFRREYAFDHVTGQRDGDPMQFHIYELQPNPTGPRLALKQRVSTDVAGAAVCLGLKADMRVEVATILATLDAKLPASAPLIVGGPLPVPGSVVAETVDPG